MMKEPFKNELCILYDDIYGDDPDYGFMNVKITNQSPFHDLSSSTRRENKGNNRFSKTRFGGFDEKRIAYQR